MIRVVLRELPMLLRSLVTDRKHLKARLIRLWQLHSKKHRWSSHVNRAFANAYRSYLFDRTIRDASAKLGKVDLVIGHDQFTLNSAYQLAKSKHALFLADVVEITTLSERSGSAIRESPWIGRMVMQLLTRRYIFAASAVFTVSKALRSHFSRLYRTRKFVLLRNLRSIDDTKIKPARLKRKLKLPAGSKLIAVINTFAPSYGVEETIQALRLLPENYHIVLIGKYATPVFEAKILDLIEKEGVVKRVHHVPPMGASKFISALMACDCGVSLLIPSVRNIQYSLPNRITDLITAKLPIVATPIFDVREVIEKYGVGTCVDDMEPGTIAKAISFVTADGNADTFNSNLEKCQAELNWEVERAVFEETVQSHFERWRRKQKKCSEPYRACIVARKPVARNNRIARFAKTLLQNGFEVTVIAEDRPDDLRKIGDVTVFSIKDLA